MDPPRAQPARVPGGSSILVDVFAREASQIVASSVFPLRQPMIRIRICLDLANASILPRSDQGFDQPASFGSRRIAKGNALLPSRIPPISLIQILGSGCTKLRAIAYRPRSGPLSPLNLTSGVFSDGKGPSNFLSAASLAASRRSPGGTQVLRNARR